MAKECKLVLEFTNHPGGWSSRTENGRTVTLPYRVKSIVNSVSYNPGQALSLAQVQDIIEAGMYHVTVVLETLR